MLYGTPYILYQLVLPKWLSDCFCMSFQSGAEFCNSHVIRGFPCQETANWTPELEFRVYCYIFFLLSTLVHSLLLIMSPFCYSRGGPYLFFSIYLSRLYAPLSLFLQ